MNSKHQAQMAGGCDCGHVRYELQEDPLYVHCCHCLWCQRETGSAFAINALIESSRVHLLNNKPILIDTPTESGLGQKMARCPHCQVAVWSHYSGMGNEVAFVKVGTLDDPKQLLPDIHIFTQSKQPWIKLPANVPVKARYYNKKELWPAASLQRFQTLKQNHEN